MAVAQNKHGVARCGIGLTSSDTMLEMSNYHSQGAKCQYMYMCIKVQKTLYRVGIYRKKMRLYISNSVEPPN
jgi:hypothetical protein